MSKMDITIPYYEDKSRINNSAIGYYLNNGPMYLKNILDNTVDNKPTQAMEQGTMIHMMLLQPEEFNDKYVFVNFNIPKTPNQKKFCDEYVNSLEIDPVLAAISAYKASYKVSKQGDSKIASDAKELLSTFEDYIDIRKQTKDKIIVNDYDYMMLHKISNNVKSHIAACELINPNNKFETHNEFHINWDYDNIPCKALLDKCTFDNNNHVCYITDLKTTSHIYDFKSSIDTFDYLRQLCFYYMACSWYIKNIKEEDPKKWKFIFNIVAISTKDYVIRVFSIPEDKVFSKKSIIDKALRDIYWHITTGKWEHYKEYYDNRGYETINFD